MFRQSSFSSARSSYSHGSMGEPDPKDTDHDVYLHSKGKFLKKNKGTKANGLVCAFHNVPVRNKNWCFTFIDFSDRTGNFAISDERGQVFKFSIAGNTYESVRMASIAVTSMCFLSSHKHQLVIAYENSLIILLDTLTKEIVGNVQSKSRSIARIIECHPSEPKILVTSDDMSVALWDLSSCICLQSLECNEAIVYAKFENKGKWIVIILEHSGGYIYSSADCKLLLHFSLPDAEKKPQWTAYSSCKIPRSQLEEQQQDPNFSVFQFLLAGSNGLIYSWWVQVESKNPDEVQGHLLGIIELPLKLHSAVSLKFLHEHEKRGPKLLILGSTGWLLVVEIEGFQDKSVGFYHVVAGVAPQLLHGNAAESELNASSKNLKNVKNENVPSMAIISPTAVGKYKPTSSANGRLATAFDYLVLIGNDGVARLWDSQAMTGTGELHGVLRSRPPRVTSEESFFVPREGTGLTPKGEKGKPLGNENPYMERSGSLAHSYSFQDLKGQAGRETKVLPGSSVEDKFTSSGSFRMNKNQYYLSDNVEKPLKKEKSNKTFPKSVKHSNSQGLKNPPGKRKVPNSSHFLRSFIVSNNKAHPMIPLNELASTPLFELAGLTEQEKQVNFDKLRSFLNVHGEFPSRYRPLIWRFLLKLPENSEAFSELVQRGIHPSYEDLHDRYPVPQKTIFDRLHRLCSQVTHWAPILGDAPYLPSLCFPFVLVFSHDELASLETVMTVMMWWGHSWHCTHPNPPTHFVDSFEKILRHHDTKLSEHLTNLDLSPGIIAWNMVSSLFTEILNRSNWLRLMDYLFCFFHKIALILLTPIAIMRELRTPVLNADTADKIMGFYRSQQGISVGSIVRGVENLLKHTPPKFMTAVTTRHLDAKRFEAGKTIFESEQDLGEVEEARVNMALYNGKPVFPLTRYNYPIYNGFPKFVTDLQIQERNRVLAMKLEIKRKDDVLSTLEKKLQEIETNHFTWMNRHQNASNAEIDHQKRLMEQERNHLRELQQIEEEICKRRLHTLTAIEKASQEEMDVMDKAAAEALKLVEMGEKHLQEKIEISMGLQKHREVAEVAERVTEEQLRQIRMRRARDDWVKGVAAAMKGKEREIASRDILLQEQWKREDAQLQMQREQRMEQMKVLEEQQKLDVLQEQMRGSMERLQLEREAKVQEIERSRAVRQAKLEAAEALESAERAQLQLQRQEMLRESVQKSELAQYGVKHAEAKLLETVEQIKTRSAQLLEEERVHLQRAQQARKEAAKAKLKEDAVRYSGEQLQHVVRTDSELQLDQLLALQRAQLQHETHKPGAPPGPAAHSVSQEENWKQSRQYIESLADNVLSDQRDRFQEMHSFMKQQRSSRDEEKMDRKSNEWAEKEINWDDAGSSDSPPVWTRVPAAIPAPHPDPGVGYGVQPPSSHKKKRNPRNQSSGGSHGFSDPSDVLESDLKLGSSSAQGSSSSEELSVRRVGTNLEEEDFMGLRTDFISSFSAQGIPGIPPPGLKSKDLSTEVSEQQWQVSDDDTPIGKSFPLSRLKHAGSRKKNHSVSLKNVPMEVAAGADFRKFAQESIRNLQVTRALNRAEIATDTRTNIFSTTTTSSTAGARTASTPGDLSTGSDAPLWAFESTDDSPKL